MSIKTKMLVPAITTALIAAALILASNTALFSNYVHEATEKSVQAAVLTALHEIDTLKGMAEASSFGISKDTAIADAVINADREALLARALTLQEEVGVEFCTITDKYGFVLARTHTPEDFGDSVVTQANINSALHGKSMSAVEGGTAVALSVRAGTPITLADGSVAGVVSVGYRLDTNSFVDSLKETLGCEAAIILNGQWLSTTVIPEGNERAAGIVIDPKIIDTVMTAGSYTVEEDIFGREALSNYHPIMGPYGEAAATLFTARYLDGEYAVIGWYLRYGVIISGASLALMITMILVMVGRGSKAVREMAAAALALAKGDTGLEVKDYKTDELKVLSEALNSITENTKRQVEIIDRIAEGEEEISLLERSEKDVINRSLAKLHETVLAQANSIRAEHERMKLMLDATPMASRLWDEDFKLIDCNQATVTLFNLRDKQEFLDSHIELSPEYQPDGQRTADKTRMMIKEAFEKGGCRYEFMYVMPDGSPLPSEVTMVRLPYRNGFVVAAYSRDLRESMEMISELDHRDKLLQSVNKAAGELLSFNTDTFSDKLHESMGVIARAISADRMYVYKNHMQDGKLCYSKLFEWSEDNGGFGDAEPAICVPYDEISPEIKKTLMANKCVHIVSHMPDSLDSEDGRFEAQVSVLQVPVFIRDEFWGYVGFDKRDAKRRFTKNEESVMRSGSILIANSLLRNEYERSLEDTKAELETALEAARKADIAKNSFLANISHEMRTPLNAVNGFSEIIINGGGLEDETESYIKKIYHSGRTLLSIVNDLLDHSKFQSDSFTVTPGEYNVPEMLNDTVTQNIIRIGERPVTFNLEIREDMPERLFGDGLRVKQIISNLLSNAFKYTEEGTVKLELDCRRDEDSVWLTVRVSDTGIGIKPENMHQLFADFTQFGDAVKFQSGGTGLGLAITKKLVELMGGNIEAESEYGSGSVFTVTIPQGYADDGIIGPEVVMKLKNLEYSPEKAAWNGAVTKISLSNARVLVVDDNTINHEVARGLMKPYGMRIDCVLSGPEAIKALTDEKARYDAVFMDHMMPGMDGIEAVRIIREEIGTDYAKTVPIIALTANAIEGNDLKFTSSGFQAFLSKPIDGAKLDAVINRWVKNPYREPEANPAPDSCLAPEDNDGALDMINGIDVLSVLERFRGSRKILRSILSSYADGTPPILYRLREYLDEGKTEDYAVAVHGIKGSSLSICANEVGKAAEALEKAALEGDIHGVRELHPGFEELVFNLIDDIETALKMPGKESGDLS